MANCGDSTVGELREDVPLKPAARKSKLCYCSEECVGGPRFISIAFGVLTAIITIALIIQIYYGDYQVVPHGSVATDARECSSIGTTVLKSGGNAVDATIASAFCLAVTNPHTTGLDAEGILMIYSHRTRTNPDVIDFTSDSNQQTPLPRLALGLAYVHLLYGKLPWSQLVEPSVNIARKGFLVSQNLVAAIRTANVPNLYGPKQAGHTMILPELADTLEKISQMTEDELYDQINPQDEPLKSQAVKLNFNNYHIYVPNAPTSGPIFLLTLEIIQQYNFTVENTETPEYIFRLAHIADEVYSNKTVFKYFHTGGTASNVAAVDLDDLYVSLVTGMSNPFGTGTLTPEGYLLDKKSLGIPPTRLPVIITDRKLICGRRMVLGTVDVVTAVQVVSNLILAGMNATVSIEQPRFNLRGPEDVTIEKEHFPNFNEAVVDYLHSIGKVETTDEPYGSCNMVEKIFDDLSSHSDSRGGGIASRF